MKIKQLCLCLIFFMSAKESFAWGPIGHRVVGEVAKRHLNYFTKKKVEAILGAESMAKASTWADEIKSDPDNYRHTFDWHYMSWPMEESDYTYKEGGGKLIKAIKDNVDILRSKKSTKTQKIHALRFIIHLIGDLHQPLHVGNGLDRGGNDCKVLFHKGKTNLHRLWDEDMINQKKLSFSEIVEFISYFSKEEIKSFMQGSPLDWARESRAYRPEVYPTPLEARPYCKRGDPGNDLPSLGYAYSYKHYNHLEKRLFQAGVRLAYLLNENL